MNLICNMQQKKMKGFRRFVNVRTFFGILASLASSVASAQSMGNYTALPASMEASIPPMVMLALSNDHQLYFKTYTDYDDLDGDNELEKFETTYSPSYEYKGYFRSDLCYSYGANNWFYPAAEVVDSQNHYCSAGGSVSATWSGNFLNWATMTRVDNIRQILYGGKRTAETSLATILERSYLPNDAHSFAKYINRADMGRFIPFAYNDQLPAQEQGVTFCNTTVHSDTLSQASRQSRTNTDAPLMRVVRGNYSLWASGERHQCLTIPDNMQLQKQAAGEAPNTDPLPVRTFGEIPLWSPEASGRALRNAAIPLLAGVGLAAHPLAPRTVDRNAAEGEVDYQVKVAVCHQNFQPEDDPGCKKYGDFNQAANSPPAYRPIGLLHTTSESTKTSYGLMTGSYSKNWSGGMLRANVDTFEDEVDPDNGNFIKDDGIIAALDAIRIAGYSSNSDIEGKVFDGINTPLWRNPAKQGYRDNDACEGGLSGDDNARQDGTCIDWGNPFGEIMTHAYHYMSGGDAAIAAFTGINTGAGAVPEPKAPTGLLVAPWQPPLNTDNWCAPLNVVGINSSGESYDHDGIQNAFNEILSTAGDQNVSLNALTAAATTEGINPGAEYFYGARADGAGAGNGVCSPKTIPDGNLQNVQGVCPSMPRQKGSYSVAGVARYVRSNDVNNVIPNEQTISTYGVALKVPTPAVEVRTPGGIVTLFPACMATHVNRVGDPTSAELPGAKGNCSLVDFQVIDITPTSGTLYVNWEDAEHGVDHDQDMHGYIQYNLNDAGNFVVRTRIVDQSTHHQLGFGYVIAGPVSNQGFNVMSGINGFYPPANSGRSTCTAATPCRDLDPNDDDNNADAWPLSTHVHTVSNGSTAEFIKPPLYFASEENGFYESNDPAELQRNLKNVLENIGPTPAAGASEIATSSNTGAANLFLHTTYYANRQEAVNGETKNVQWVGQIGALMIDNKNQLREDTVANKRLDDGDNIIVFVGTDAEGNQMIARYGSDEDPSADDATPVYALAETLAYLWTTTDTLGATDPANRNIYTAAPTQLGDANVITGDLVDFDNTLLNGNNAQRNQALFGGADNVAQLIEFTRGEEIDGLRSRTFNNQKYLVGDITGGGPIILSTPDYSYDTELGDTDYTTYRNNRRNDPIVVITASNNGLIQAFDAGTYNNDMGGFMATGATLGEELWAYAPVNLLPHLQWLASEDYRRVPYFDGFMRTYDVKIFPEDDDLHPGGWGTILVVGTGRGAGHFPLDTNGDGNDDFATRPAYIILDVTDRSNQPKLIAEISHEELGFTTGEPDVIRYVSKAVEGNNPSPATSDWFLVFGSGPRGDNAQTRRAAQLGYESDVVAAGLNGGEQEAAQKPRLFVFKLEANGVDQTNLQLPVVLDDALENAFVGGVNGMDWNRDFKDNAIYFGTISGTAENPTGKLLRGNLSLGAGSLGVDVSVAYDMNRPVVARPTTVIDYQKNYWVYASSGRNFIASDSRVIPPEPNLMIGFKETKMGSDGSVSAATATGLLQVNGIDISRDGFLSGNVPGLAGNPAGIDTREEFKNEMLKEANRGWLRQVSTANERSHFEAGYAASIVTFGTNSPGEVTSCESSSSGFVYQLDMFTGLPSQYSAVGLNGKPFVFNGVTFDETAPVNTPVTGRITGSPDPVKGLVPTDQGFIKDEGIEIVVPSTRQSWREVPITW